MTDVEDTEVDRPVPESVPPRTVLVTGSSGFVGVNLLPRLRDLGWKLRTLDLHPPETGSEDEDHRNADIRDRDAVRSSMDGVDAVIHLASRITVAAEDPEAWDINVRGAATVAAAARDCGVPRLVHCSSVHAYDHLPGTCIDETGPRATDPRLPVYARSKFAGEVEVRARIEDGLDATIVNPTAIIGPIDLGPSRINAVIDTAARGLLPVAIRAGYDWVDVRDVVDALIVAVDHGRTGENYIVGGRYTDMLRLARLAAGFSGRLGPLFAVPLSLVRRVAPAGELVSRRFGSDIFTTGSLGVLMEHPFVRIDKARRELGHDPRPLEDTVRDVIGWFGSEEYERVRHRNRATSRARRRG